MLIKDGPLEVRIVVCEIDCTLSPACIVLCQDIDEDSSRYMFVCMHRCG